MDIVELATFAAVARLGAITRAAEDLQTVQSNVTARIRLLEQELGVPLFHRHARGVTLTSAGEQLLPYATKIVHLLAEARHAVADQSVPRGPLRVGSLESTAARRLPGILAAYTTAYPQVGITLVTGTTGALTQDVLDYRLEGALVAGPVGHPDLTAEHILDEELVLVTAPGSSSPTALGGDGRGIKILVLRAGCSYRERLERLLAAREVAISDRLEFGTLDGIIGCVSAGIGLTLLPRAVVEPARRRGLVAVHAVPREEAHAPTVFIRRRDTFVSAALARFVEVCRAEASAPPAELTSA